MTVDWSNSQSIANFTRNCKPYQRMIACETQEEYDQWIKTQKTVSQKLLTQN